MKKTYLIIAATALVALSACTKNEVRSISDEPSQITWQTVIGPKSTKALVDGNTFDQKYKFKTYAFYNANGTTWPTGASLYIDNAEVSYHEITGAAGTTGSKYWGTEQQYYWPKGGSLTFFAYTIVNGDENNKATSYPANVSCDATDGLKVTGYDVDANQNLDFMVADIKSGQTANTTSSQEGVETGVPTMFRHTLTQITGFNVMTAGEYKKVESNVIKAGSYVVTINKIKIVNAFTTGDYQLENSVNPRKETWSNPTNVRNEKNPYVYTVPTGKSAELNGSSYVSLANDQKAFLPQKFAKVNYTYKGTTALEKARERRTQAYIVELKKVPYIEFSYSVSYYGKDGQESFKDDATDYIALEELNGTGDYTWGINKKITYNVIINLAGDNGEMVIYWDPTVKEWEEEEITGGLS